MAFEERVHSLLRTPSSCSLRLVLLPKLIKIFSEHLPSQQTANANNDDEDFDDGGGADVDDSGIDWTDKSDDENAVDMDDFDDKLFNAAPDEVCLGLNLLTQVLDEISSFLPMSTAK